MPTETPTARAPRSIPRDLVLSASTMLATFAAIFAFRWLTQHHVPDVEDARMVASMVPLYLVFRACWLLHARRTTSRQPPIAD
jgi:multidrug resistance efflux pump